MMIDSEIRSVSSYDGRTVAIGGPFHMVPMGETLDTLGFGLRTKRLAGASGLKLAHKLLA